MPRRFEPKSKLSALSSCLLGVVFFWGSGVFRKQHGEDAPPFLHDFMKAWLAPMIRNSLLERHFKTALKSQYLLMSVIFLVGGLTKIATA